MAIEENIRELAAKYANDLQIKEWIDEHNSKVTANPLSDNPATIDSRKRTPTHD